MAEGSSSGIFKALFIDIGDEQSIENDLSTYSSHLNNMAHFSSYAAKATLFLIDEFGAGTDPHYGGAIAEAILERLLQSGARGLVTTHYYNLKKYAEATRGIVNGRMRFDVKKLDPLYQLEIGRHGSSFSLEIAGKTGLPHELLLNARKKIGTDQIDLDKLLNELEVEKKQFEDRNRKAREKDHLLEMTLKNYTELKQQLENEKKLILNKAREEARAIIDKTNQEAERLIKAIRENKAEKVTTKQKREEFRELKKELKTEPVIQSEKTDIIVLKGPVIPGDRVRIKGTFSVGEVLSVSKKEASIAFGDIKSKVKLNRIEKIDWSGTPTSKEPQNKASSNFRNIDLSKRKSTFISELDLRGQRGETALTELMHFIDDAVMYSMTQIRIIHGKGNGILRRLVRDQLSNHPNVKSVKDEHADRGGDGVSVVELK
jgi:DNA mismatch repair protein MutS2